ncbi:MAG: M3 family oligoendopeptidase [Hyphomicrobium sp.]|uniref:M3 family oligoendopeptidase n=1 Tax=Hyphomicrobium sp. TaxID=82 RepID=UPI003D1443AF
MPDDTKPAGSAAPLPVWDLADLYPGAKSPALTADLERAAGDARSFRERYESKLAGLSGAELAAAVRLYEAIGERLGRLQSYAQLAYAADMTDPELGRFHQTIMERSTDIASDLLFFTLEINRIEDDALAAKLKAPDLAHYRPWLDRIRAFRPHQLSDEVEQTLHQKQITGGAAWQRLFDETTAEMRFPVDGKPLGIEGALTLLTDRDGRLRREAAKAIAGGFRERIKTFALISNTLAKDKEIEDRWRHFPRPVSARNLANHVEDEVVDALVAAVKAHYAPLSHRYYRLKAKWFGRSELDYWDRNAPLPDDTDREFDWPAARGMVLGAYGAFSPKLAELGRRFFDRPWIDAAPREGKAPGAFAHPTVPSAHPYLLMSYRGRARDVMTLAHELGHGVHQLLAAPQGALMAETPLTLAETASVFGEMLTFRALLDAERDPQRRRILIAGKVEDMLNTVVRQIAMHEFERRFHDARRESEQTAEEIGRIWLETQAEALGAAIRLDADYSVFWAYIPHFIHSAFYVYAYAFGDCLVNSLYAVYRERPADFPDRYFALLAAGGSKNHRELLAPFGLDAGDPAFWSKGLGVIGGLIDELEAL